MEDIRNLLKKFNEQGFIDGLLYVPQFAVSILGDIAIPFANVLGPLFASFRFLFVGGFEVSTSISSTSVSIGSAGAGGPDGDSCDSTKVKLRLIVILSIIYFSILKGWRFVNKLRPNH